MENINLRTVDRNFEDYLEDVLLSGTNYNDKYVAFSCGRKQLLLAITKLLKKS